MPIYQYVVFMMSMRERACRKQQQYIVLDKVAAMKMILEAKVVSVHAVNKLYKKKFLKISDTL